MFLRLWTRAPRTRILSLAEAGMGNTKHSRFPQGTAPAGPGRMAETSYYNGSLPFAVAGRCHSTLVILRLRHAEPIAKRVFKYGFDPVELLRWLRKELYALGFKFCVGLAAICGIESASAQCALLDETDNRGHILLLQLRPGRHLHEDDLKARLALGRHSEPTKAIRHGLVGVYLKAQF